MKPEKGKRYEITLLDGKVKTLKFIKDAPGNVLLFETQNGESFSVPTGGFTHMKEITK